MTTAEALGHMLRQALYLAVLLSAPVLLAVLATGLVMGLLQAVTQIRERTLSVVPKILIAFLVLAVMGGWMASELVRFTGVILAALPGVGKT